MNQEAYSQVEGGVLGDNAKSFKQDSEVLLELPPNGNETTAGPGQELQQKQYQPSQQPYQQAQYQQPQYQQPQYQQPQYQQPQYQQPQYQQPQYQQPQYQQPQYQQPQYQQPQYQPQNPQLQFSNNQRFIQQIPNNQNVLMIVQPQPQLQETPGNIVFMQQPQTNNKPITHMHVSENIFCFRCNKMVQTKVTKRVGSCTWCACFGLCFIGCCYIPFCIKTCKDTEHCCPNCNTQLGYARKRACAC